MAIKREGLEWASVKIPTENHTFDFIHSKRRNRLKASRAAALVNVFSNIRMLRRGSAVNKPVETPDWVVEDGYQADSESEHSFDEPDSSDSDSSL